MKTTSERIVRLAFRGSWRRYQELALAAFQRDVDAGRRRTHDPAAFPRYLVSRLVPGNRSAGVALLRTLRFRRPFEHRWFAVPADLGRHKERARAFARAWRRWLGPGGLVFTQRTEAGRDAPAVAGSQAPDYEASKRRVWL
jgi:hypothetical protein